MVRGSSTRGGVGRGAAPSGVAGDDGVGEDAVDQLSTGVDTPSELGSPAVCASKRNGSGSGPLASDHASQYDAISNTTQHQSYREGPAHAREISTRGRGPPRDVASGTRR